MANYALGLLSELQREQKLLLIQHVRSEPACCPSCEAGDHEQLIGDFCCDCPCHGQFENNAIKLQCL